jgi:hypothetical protein
MQVTSAFTQISPYFNFRFLCLTSHVLPFLFQTIYFFLCQDVKLVITSLVYLFWKNERRLRRSPFCLYIHLSVHHPYFLLGSLWVTLLSVCVCVSLLSLYIMRSPCCLCVSRIIARQQDICMFVCPPNYFVLYVVHVVQRKVGNYFFPELLVLTFVIHIVVFRVTMPYSLIGEYQYFRGTCWNPCSR